MHPLLSFFLLVISVSASQAHKSSELRLHLVHRVVHPNLPVTPWSELGTVPIPSFTSIQPTGFYTTLSLEDSLQEDFAGFSEAINPNMEGAMYHVAIEYPPSHEALWPVSSMKACLLPSSTSANVVIHFSVEGEPFAIDYAVSPVPRDGICPEINTGSYPVHNASVTLKSPRLPPLPELRVPPPLTPEGEPMMPVPEKSFVQKYWIYMVVVLGALLISGPAEEPANGDAKGGK